MNMYRGIEDSLAALPPGQAEQFAESYYARFHGFDGNEEADHYSVANFLVAKLDLFQEFAGRDLNSHMPMLPRYGRMLAAFEEERRAGGGPGNGLSADQLHRLLAAD
ncbi:MAG: YfbU family protein [Alphaproteobacteria bacterium]|nr:YfbU family protein [Alphaproteobacteria bacterium]